MTPSTLNIRFDAGHHVDAMYADGGPGVLDECRRPFRTVRRHKDLFADGFLNRSAYMPSISTVPIKSRWHTKSGRRRHGIL